MSRRDTSLNFSQVSSLVRSSPVASCLGSSLQGRRPSRLAPTDVGTPCAFLTVREKRGLVSSPRHNLDFGGEALSLCSVRETPGEDDAPTSIARNRIARALGLLFLLLFLGSCAAATRVEGSKATLWVVHGDRNRVYLLGSIHVLSKQAYPLKPALERAFEDANLVVFEIDLTRFNRKSFQKEFSRTACYPSGQSLSKKLTPKTIELLNRVLPLYGLSLKKVERLKPWFVAETLSARTLEMAGFSDQLGIDLYFYHKAETAGKRVLGLETLRDQAEIFAQFNDEQNEQYLLSTLSGLPEYTEMIRRLVIAWKNGNTQVLDRLLNQDKQTDPATHDALFARRNARWLPEIERFAHENGNYLVIVGAGHLVGDDGVVAQLRRAGYLVQQL
jgi:uncharacterized protein YbaP (TraB family)